MKKLVLSIVSLMAFSSANAQLSTTTCYSTRGDVTLQLFVFEQDLKQLRVVVGTGLPRAVPFTKLANQPYPEKTVYVLTQGKLLEVDNGVLSGQGGYLAYEGEHFSCDSF